MKGGTDSLGNVFCAHAPAARYMGFIPSPGLVIRLRVEQVLFGGARLGLRASRRARGGAGKIEARSERHPGGKRVKGRGDEVR